jgi:hypothetical protein
MNGIVFSNKYGGFFDPDRLLLIFDKVLREADGRRLLFVVRDLPRPLLDMQKCRVA